MRPYYSIRYSKITTENAHQICQIEKEKKETSRDHLSGYEKSQPSFATSRRAEVSKPIIIAIASI